MHIVPVAKLLRQPKIAPNHCQPYQPIPTPWGQWLPRKSIRKTCQIVDWRECRLLAGCYQGQHLADVPREYLEQVLQVQAGTLTYLESVTIGLHLGLGREL